MTRSRVSASRVAAVRILGDVRRREARARDLLRGSKHMEQLDERDRAQATRLVMGVTASRGLLDQVIDSHVRSRSGIEPQVRDALRVAAFELLFLSTPSSVAASQGVELVRGVRPRAAGMANAVLRRVAAEDVPIREAARERLATGESRVEDLAWVSGYPMWLLERIKEDRGDEACVAFAQSALEPAPVYVAPNLGLVNTMVAQELMGATGLEPHALDDDVFVLGRPAGLARSGLVQGVRVVPADLSAQHVANLVADLVAPAKAGRLLEVGQGRGTKTILMQNAARRGGYELFVTAMDVEGFKTKLARKRMADAGLADRVTCVTFDACGLDEAAAADALGAREPFDVVFVDAPCSGVGTLRRHPEIAWSLLPNDVDALRELQLRMLCAASVWVRPGGALCYATCSVLKAEDEGVVSAFLRDKRGRAFEPTDAPFLSLPQPDGPDGHFCVVLRRV
ncbi:MAG: transcription antitermination factor NusB [Coriobacteriales bacterium]|nr:transcription antitermination factor NusB [Coriobacteriales bacterium]